jgi:indole-3-glycerol phosphate synthase
MPLRFYDVAVLDPILQSTQRRLLGLLPQREPLQVAANEAAPASDFIAALRADGLGVIAEVKRASPSAGEIAPDLDASALARQYEAGGAAAISVLTEPDHFGGSLEDLTRVSDTVHIPVLRKDFILDPIQIYEARAAGADAVLLIASILDPDLLQRCLDVARGLGMAALVEAHDADEIAVAVGADADAIGINNRDLTTFAVDLGTGERLRKLIPAGVVAVAESGIRSPGDAIRMAEAGFDAVLVGQGAVSSGDPARFVRGLRA